MAWGRGDTPVIPWTRIGGPPSLVSAPAVMGQLTVGATLTASPGVWTGSPFAFAYQWRENGLAIAGETGSTLLIGSGLIGDFLSVTVIPTNGGGTGVAATSPVVGPVTNPTSGPSLDFSDPNNSQYLGL